MLSDDVLNRLNNIPVEQQLAFATGCVYRVFDLYMDLADPYLESLWRAIEMSWSQVEGGSLDELEHKRLYGMLDKESKKYISEEEVDIPHMILYASLKMLDVVAAKVGSGQSAFDAANSVAEAVDNTDSLSDADGGLEEEEDWQLEWLSYCLTHSPSDAQDECKKRTQSSPQWYVRFES